MKWTNKADLIVGLDTVLEAGRPENRIDAHATESLVQQVLRRAMRRREYPP